MFLNVLWTIAVLAALVSSTELEETCIRGECRDFFGRCLSVNRTNQVCRDIDGLCRSDGERWDYINCLTLECRSHRIIVVSRKCHSAGECLIMSTENQLCRDHFGNCRRPGSRWKYKCHELTCRRNKASIVNAKCCVRDSKGCIKPLECRSPGEIWTVPGKGTPQTCAVTKNKKGRLHFRYITPPY
ncbi:uncharacterized protein LOC125654497 isoform X1 [Ostrea edulis]|uniref:uncharacterized protein LOC125654497 isoform X1 n=1 Tax=Ostrea edulis TaxID=37623 RepID=UPI002095E037|nr:uncharacterized protein LOC125654497 isoform X1 [Ostrea edulis]